MNQSKRLSASPQTSPDVVTPASIADYIFDISGELTVMAERGQLRLLAYLLSMVHAEADNLRKEDRGKAIESITPSIDRQDET